MCARTRASKHALHVTGVSHIQHAHSLRTSGCFQACAHRAESTAGSRVGFRGRGI